MTNESRYAFIGTSTDADDDGVFGVRVDAAGTLDRVSATNAGTEPMFLAPNSTGDRLYVTIRPDAGGRVVAYDIDRETDTLSRLNDAPTKGNGTPCYCSVDATDQCVLTAQYDGGTVSVLPIDGDGRVGDPTAVVEHEGSGPDPDRQSEPHPHAIRPGPDNEYAYAPDLGADRICIYDFDATAGTLDPAACGHVEVHDGAGPRHLDFHPNGRFVYLIDELDSTVVAYERDADTGALEAFETVSTLPEGFEGENYPADVHVHPSGEFLYGSNRGHDSIAVFELDADGRPSLLDTESTRGEWPRNFALAPTGEFLFAENADSDTVVSFRVEDDGTLDPTGDVLDVPSPVCMQFVGE
jgi:6-phosphogluconolactonase